MGNLMNDQVLRSRLIRLANEKPELRQHLLPLLKQASAGLDKQIEKFEDELSGGMYDEASAKKFVALVKGEIYPTPKQVQDALKKHVSKVVDMKGEELQNELDDLWKIWTRAGK